MAMIYNSIPYFPTQVSFFEEVAMELIEARYGMKAETAVMKLVCKIYKENGYYMVWNEEQCILFTNKVGREIANFVVVPSKLFRQEILATLFRFGL